jgi:hypothetical protein
VYMTAQMRTHAHRYGSVLCLDAQKWQYNRSDWPYIAPCVKDNEMKVAVTAESIVTEENHEYYVWIIRCMVEIEPWFQLCNVHIILRRPEDYPNCSSRPRNWVDLHFAGRLLPPFAWGLA